MTLFALDVFFGIIHTIIVAAFFNRVFGTKHKLLSMVIVPVVINVVHTTLDYMGVNHNIMVTVSQVSIFLSLLFLFNGKISKKLLTFLVYFLLSFACDFLVFTLTGSFGIQNTVLFAVVMNSMMIVLLYLVFAVAAKYISDFGKIYDKRLYLVFILIPITQFGFIATLVNLMNSMGIIADSYKSISTQQISIIISALLIFTLIADIAFLDVTRKAAESFRDKERLQTLETEAKVNYKYYEDLQANTDKMRKYRHDTNNIIQSIYSLLENPDKTSSAEAMKLAKTLEAEINSINLNHYCSHAIVNAVLVDKEKIFTKADINYRFNVNVPQNISISGFELCRIFSNMLDNALEACENSTQKAVSLDASIIDGYLYIKMRNPVVTDKKVINPERGNGLEIMKQITDKYNSETIVTVENEIFETLVTMKCEK